MMLDAKRTFDEVIERLAPDAATRDEILANRIYQQLSSAVAGSQEFTAIAKLYELDQEGDYDLLVLDTPPSRNALDFLDAPGRLTGFFQGRAIRMFLRPAGIGGKIIGRGTGVVFSLLQARHRRRPARGPVGVLPLARRADRRLHRARRARRRAARGPGDDVPDRHLAAARPGRGGDLLPPQAARGGDAVRRHGRQPRARGARRRTARCRPSWSTSSARRWPSAWPTRRTTRRRWPRATTRRSTTSRRSCDSPPTIRIPELEDDVHDIDGLAQVRAHLFADSD